MQNADTIKSERVAHKRSLHSSHSHSHHHHHHHHHHHQHQQQHRSRNDASSDRPRKRTRTSSPVQPVSLPYKARSLSKHDLEPYKALFTSYLDLQKQKDIFELSDSEVKGRWKSFYQKWNRGDLAQGWYEPSVKARADLEWALAGESSTLPNDDAHTEERTDHPDTDFGPAPAPVTFESLAERDETRADAAEARRFALRRAHQADKELQKERLNEIAPRAEAGTRERMIEKKREVGDAARAYREGKSSPGEVAEVNEGDLIGGGGLEEAKAMRMKEQTRKTEREQRRAEIWEARKAEREQRMAGAKEKEAKTMDMFKKLAVERFGGRPYAPVTAGPNDQNDDSKMEKAVAEKFKRN